jgi:hypothetical protein
MMEQKSPVENWRVMKLYAPGMGRGFVLKRARSNPLPPMKISTVFLYEFTMEKCRLGIIAGINYCFAL